MCVHVPVNQAKQTQRHKAMDAHHKPRRASITLHSFFRGNIGKRPPEREAATLPADPVKPVPRSTAVVGGFIESRKSVSHTETTNAARTAALTHVKVISADMPASMQAHAFRCARRALGGGGCGGDGENAKFSSKQMACTIKKEFDEEFGPVWHCIVGASFGSFVTHSTGCFVYFSIENLFVMVFKTKIRRVLVD
ncbi:hypothetical protein QJS04_geneDACA005633 [Acorus gramineus]|uniref:Dynein light chain 1, cytoplasmic n=1 Tax=Acorus gramineus TaxID=55184 RepID=A0AAV9A5E4_ACOGR|nr:hypothetical protein QJS04_geneDACA005633 [Acorus gramineus]